MKSLVVYYSLSGNTRTVATAIARELGADIEEIHCRRYGGGGWSYLRAAIDSWRGRLPEIDAPSRSPAGYDLVVVGGPVWTGHLAPPVRAWLAGQQPRLSGVAFFVTFGGRGAERALQEMREQGGAEPKATLTVREDDIKKGRFSSAVVSFAAKLRERLAA